MLRPASAIASFALVIAAVTPGLAAWVDETGVDVGVKSAAIDLDVAGDLAFDLTGCSSGGSDCSRFEDESLVGLPAYAVGSADFAVSRWIDKDGEIGEHVGFEFSVSGAPAQITIKSGDPEHENGSLYRLDAVEPGTHMWINPACTPTGGGADCDPARTSAVSYLDVCFPAEGGCDGATGGTLSIANHGTLPVSVGLTISDPSASVCTAPAVDVELSSVDTLLYSGSLCFLVDEPLALFDQLNPGEERQVQLAVALGVGVDPAPGPVALDLVAEVTAIQWNDESGWRARMSLPMSVAADIAAPCAPEPGEVPPPDDPDLVGPPTAKPPSVDPPDDPPVVEPPVEPTVDPPVVEPPVVEPPVVEPPVVEPPVEPPVDPPVDPPVVEPPEEPPPEDPPPDEPPADPSTGELAGVVWIDDSDGIRTEADPNVDPPLSGEPGAAGVAVALFDAAGNQLATATTGPQGEYRFTDLAPGTYRVRFEAPTGHEFVSAGMGTDPTHDSDVREIERIEEADEVVSLRGWTDPVELTAETAPGIADAGLLPPAAPDPPDAPPAEDPDELATEPPEQPRIPDQDPGTEPLDPDDGVAGAGTEAAEGEQ